MTWHPPIPSEAVYRPEVAELGAGLRLLWYLYNGVRRDGTVEFSIKRAADALNAPYETIRTWWQVLKKTDIVSTEADLGKKGFILKFDDEWLDWHVLERNYDTPVNGSSTKFERATQPVEKLQASVNGSSTVLQRANDNVEHPAYKVLMSDQESECVSVENTRESTARESRTPALEELAKTIADVCRINPKLARKKQRDGLNEVYARLKAIGAAADDVRAREVWWYENDWRAKKESRPPRWEELLEIWDMVKPIPSNHKQARNGTGPPLPVRPVVEKLSSDKLAELVRNSRGPKPNDTS
jgi:hypothetical protein